jgi:endonuclease/exonuclease/phosphatase (EEP) superfamily protein YafD
MGRQKTSHGSNPRLRVMLLNVNTTTGNPALVKKEIQAADPDILVLEEINRRWIGELAWLKASHPHSITQPREDNFGIGVFSKQPLLDAKVVHLGLSIPSILAFLEIPGNRLRIVATHPTPPTSRDYARWRNKQLDLLPDALGTAAPVVLVGDLNVTPWNHYFRTLLKRTGLRDSAAGRGFQPTWPNTSSFFRIPIDHVLHSPDLAVVERRVGNDVDSDHSQPRSNRSPPRIRTSPCPPTPSASTASSNPPPTASTAPSSIRTRW